MKLAIVRERRPNEKRVAASPETVKKLRALGLDVLIESGAGAGARFGDDAYREAGATLAPSESQVLQDADLIFKVQPPLGEELVLMKRGAMLVGMLNPFADRMAAQAYAERGVDAFTLEFLPRITRAQSMDVLSSQSNLAGYKAVIEAANLFERAMPQMMTAAGTIAPARVFVMGAGVAGLQAIATARRLGARVSATDVRPVAKEQVESLGATYVMIDDAESKEAETGAGYAREMSEAFHRKQIAVITEIIAKQDIVITTAQIPGRPAPRLLTEAMVASMKPGSVIIDLAIEQGGNCALSKAGEVVEFRGVKIAAHINLSSRLAADASALYARNLLHFITPLFDGSTKSLKLDWNDEIIKGTALTRGGQVIHPAFKNQNAAE